MGTLANLTNLVINRIKAFNLSLAWPVRGDERVIIPCGDRGNPTPGDPLDMSTHDVTAENTETIIVTPGALRACWGARYTRDGSFSGTCPPGRMRDGLFCNPHCTAGYRGIASFCLSPCLTKGYEVSRAPRIPIPLCMYLCMYVGMSLCM